MEVLHEVVEVERALMSFSLQSQDGFLPSIRSFFSASVSLSTIRLMLDFKDKEFCKA